MRFRSLHLRPFGAFEDQRFDFDVAETGGLHLVYGPNGAGKSTTLEAIRAVLYGIKQGTGAHRFPAKELRIAADLVRADGTELHFVRRNATKLPLWNETDDASFGKEVLLPFLGGFDREQFVTFFGLDLATMVEGGKQLLAGAGVIGEALFGAGLGGARLAATTARLESEIAGLYGERALNASINRLLKEHKELSKELNAATMSKSAFDRERRALKSARTEIEALGQERSKYNHELDELTRLERGLGPLGRWDAAQRELAQHRNATPLGQELVARYREVSEEVRQLRASRAERERQQRERAAELEELQVRSPEKVQAVAEAIRALGSRSSAYEDALEGVARCEQKLATKEAELGREHARLGTSSDAAADLAAVDLGQALEALSPLSRAREQARNDEALTRAELARAETAVARAKEALQGVEARAAQELAVELTDLAPFEGSIAELSELVPPASTALDQRAKAEAELDDRRRAHTTEREAIERLERESNETLARLADDPLGAPPTDADLHTARTERDARWEALRAAVLAGERAEAAEAAALDRAIPAADAVADRLRAEQARGQEAMRAQRDLEQVRQRRERLDEELATTERQTAEADERWRAVWARAGFAPLDAQEMRRWIERRRSLLNAVEERRVSARGEVSKSQEERDERAVKHELAERALQDVDARWQDWTKRVRIDPELGEERALERLRSLQAIRQAGVELAELGPERERLRGLVDHFERESADLAATLEGVVPLAVTGTTARDIAIARANALTRALEKAAADRSKVEACQQAQAEASRQDERDVRRSEALSAELDELRVAVGVESLEALAERVELSDRLRSLGEEASRAEAELLELLGTGDFEAFRRSIGERSRADLLDSVNDLRAKLDEQQARLAELHSERGRLEANVEGEGSAAAAQLGSRRALVEAELATLTESYAEVVLARHLLRREIERYREQHQGPLLERAAELFRILTLETYVSLVASENAKGQPVMVARRADGTNVEVEGMSSGTQDQLFLALRIASVEHMLRTAEPMPFIADDLFVNFDDERTEAALRVLQELARSTQVIVFSHHRSVAEAARRLEHAGGKIGVHDLESERAREAGR